MFQRLPAVESQPMKDEAHLVCEICSKVGSLEECYSRTAETISP